MNELIIQYGIVYLFLTGILVWRPWLSRKNVVFGVVFGDIGVWQRSEIKKVRKRFVLSCLGIAFLLAGIYLLVFITTKMNEGDVTRFYFATIIALLLMEIIPFVIANRSVKKLKRSIPQKNLVKDKITVEIGGSNDIEPLSVMWFLLLLVPIIAAIVFVILYYPQIPGSIATHYNIKGIADKWSEKSINVVMWPIFSQILLAGFMFVVGILTRYAPASVKGNPKAAPNYPSFRRIITASVIAIAMIVELKFLATELLYAGMINNMKLLHEVIPILVAIIVVILIIAFFMWTRSRIPSGTILDDDSKWILGIFYFNPSDSSIFIEKRHGIGQTINFGRPVVWIAALAIIVIAVLTHFMKS
jgi:uncharacterized membrane protein